MTSGYNAPLADRRRCSGVACPLLVTVSSAYATTGSVVAGLPSVDMASSEAAELLRDRPGTMSFERRLCDDGRASELDAVVTAGSAAVRDVGETERLPGERDIELDVEGPASAARMPKGAGMVVGGVEVNVSQTMPARCVCDKRERDVLNVRAK